MKSAHTDELIADILYSILEHFSIIKHHLYITTNNTRNNSIIRKELEELLNNLDINNDWSSESIKILCLAHMIQLVVKAILGAFNIILSSHYIIIEGISIVEYSILSYIKNSISVKI